MAQDTALLRYLLKGARRAPGSGSQRDLAFEFDGTDDYISSNATIGRTGYDMNVSGNVSTGSDGDGSYLWINGNRDGTAGTGTQANITQVTGLPFNQGTSFTIKVRAKINAYAPNNVSGLFGGVNQASINYTTTNTLTFGLRGSSTVSNNHTTAFTLGTMFDAYLVYDSSTQKFYDYVGSTLLNVGGTTGPATFTFSTLGFDDGCVAGTRSSSSKYLYHAAIRNKALTQSEIDADIALGNTAKNDPSIVAYYVPENLQYNTQYMLNPKDLTNASWPTVGGTTVTADTTIAPDGTTTADTVDIPIGALNRVEQINLTITGASLASKTFIIKAFVKVASGTSQFRLRMTHRGVADYQSSNLTATTDWQEFTFSQAFTSSTSGTGIVGAILNDSGGLSAISLLVRNVRLFLVNETLRDESPNIGGFIGWKTQKVLSCWLKPNIDGTATSTSQTMMSSPRLYIHVRDTANNIFLRYADKIAAKTITTPLGSGFRSKVNVVGVFFWNGTRFDVKLYVNGASVGSYSGTPTIDAPNSLINGNLWVGRYTSAYFSGNIRDARIYTFTGSFTNADALAIYNGGEPVGSGITKYLHYKPPVGELGTTTQDQSNNDRDGTLNGGVTRNYI